MVQSGLRIRPFRDHDAAPFHAVVVESVRELEPWMPWCHDGYTTEEAIAWVTLQSKSFEQRNEYEFLVVDQSGEIVGACGLNQIDPRNRRANLGYWMRSPATGRGNATSAVRLLVQWAAANTDLQRLEVVVATANAASIRVTEKAGAMREGVLRSRVLLHGLFHDAVIFAFIRGENMLAVE
jgi:ribosomal-protein-serine acetyltransferase